MLQSALRNIRSAFLQIPKREHTVVLRCSQRSISVLANAGAQRIQNADVLGLGKTFVQPHLKLATFHGFWRSSSRTFVTRTDNDLSPTTFPDPDRPDLFYHLFEPPSPLSQDIPIFALSFLSTKPAAVDSCAVIGWLPAATAGEEGGAGLNDFRENQKFLGVLHEAIHSALRDGVDEIQKNGAIQTQQDSRNIPALGRIGDPDDIIASVRVEEGKVYNIFTFKENDISFAAPTDIGRYLSTDAILSSLHFGRSPTAHGGSRAAPDGGA
ncbi:hypothetical protein EIP86_009407 [Pleurotus ostreatoroseus]|nr:hypothetical protein EIP86_009407 [Pleurotus ostreatoroseus]